MYDDLSVSDSTTLDDSKASLRRVLGESRHGGSVTSLAARQEYVRGEAYQASSDGVAHKSGGCGTSSHGHVMRPLQRRH